MPQADFIAGAFRAVIARASEVSDTLTANDFPEELRTRVRNALVAFYDANAAAIESAPGVPGVATRGYSVSFQAGIEFGTVIMRQRTSAKDDDWGASLASAMTSAALAMRRVRIRRIAGALSFEELDG